MRDRFLWIGCLVYAALFSALGAIKFAVHRNLVDFGIFEQTAASAFGCFCNTVEGNHWAYHFSPILYAVGAITVLIRSPLVLVILQALAGALVAPPIYAMVRAYSDIRIARLAAFVVWLYPPLGGLIFGDFHENGFAPAAVAWTLYAFDAGLLGWALLGALITLTIKEDQAAFLTIGGALGAWRFRGTPRGRAAAAIGVVSLFVFIAFFGYIRPHAVAGAPVAWAPWRFYAWHFGAVHFAAWEAGARVGFLLLIFVPLLFLPFRSGMMWLAAAPLAEVLLSRMPTTFTLGTHYAGAWIGYVLVAFAGAARALNRRAQTLLILCIGLCVLELAVADPLHPGLNLRRPQTRDTALDAFLATLPPNLDVATQEEAYTHLALTDPYARLLPEMPDVPLCAPDVLVDFDFPDSARLQEYGPALARLVRDGRYRLVERRANIRLYERSAAAASSTRPDKSLPAATIR